MTTTDELVARLEALEATAAEQAATIRLLFSCFVDQLTEIGQLQRQDMANRTRIRAASEALLLAGAPVNEGNDDEAVFFGKLRVEERKKLQAPASN